MDNSTKPRATKTWQDALIENTQPPVENDYQEPVKVKRTPEELDLLYGTVSQELVDQIKEVRKTGTYHPALVFTNLTAIAASFLGPDADEDDVVKFAQRLWAETTP